MLKMADIQIEPFIEFFAKARIPIAFLVPTETGYNKSIMDATGPVRRLFKETHLHNYETQGQGPENKVIIPSYFLTENAMINTSASLYRPITKQGDPRIWFYNLTKYCNPNNLLALMIVDSHIFVINLSNPKVRNSMLMENGYIHSLIQHAVNKSSIIAKELLSKLKDIHKEGFIASIGYGDTAVGMTLEDCLGIQPNSLKTPDYKGIELKATRIFKRPTHLATLFSQVPDWKNSRLKNAKQIIGEWGYWSEIDGKLRRNLYCTVKNKPNPQGLYLSVNENKNILINYGKNDLYQNPTEVVQWNLDEIKNRLSTKHNETFWISATTKIIDNREYFRYDRVMHTSKPNIHLVEHLFESGVMSLDYAMHIKENGESRDHGYLFRIDPKKFSLLFPEPVFYELDE